MNDAQGSAKPSASGSTKGSQPETNGHGTMRRAKASGGAAVGSSMPFLLISMFLIASVAFSLHCISWTPQVRGLDSPATEFSEARALQHVEHLANVIGPRVVGTPAEDQAARYIMGEAYKIAELAAKRSDLKVEVVREQVSGAANMEWFRVDFTNAYNNFSNVLLAITPVPAPPAKGVLVSAHFDSTLGTPGAADCAACVGVALELARSVVADAAAVPAAPLLFLLNGGEEALCTAAHGFMQHSGWAAGLGAFIDLEATGSAGPDVVFQHTSRWTIEAYSRVAPYPRGSAMAQDFFELKLIPADTDYKMFSYKEMGRLPGLDVALLLDAAAYHTTRDTPDRLQPGALQAMGENMRATVLEFARVLLSKGEADIVPEEDAVFFDVAGIFMLCYPWSLGRRLHMTPLALALLSPLSLLAGSKGGRAGIGAAYGALLRQVGVTLLSALGGILVPGLLGVARVYFLGKPMVWYGKDAVAYAMFVPAGIAALLAPHAWRAREPVEAGVQGSAVVWALVAAGLTAVGAKSGYLGVWAVGGLLSIMAFRKASPPLRTVWVVACAVIPALVIQPVGLVLMQHAYGKVTLSGSLPAPIGPLLADLAMGCITGAVTASCFGFLPAWLATTSRRAVKRTVKALLLTSVLAAVAASLALQPYTASDPKKLFVLHLHEQAPASQAVVASRWVLASVDSVPVGLARGQIQPPPVPLPGVDVLKQLQVLYPASLIMQGEAYEAPGPHPTTAAPKISLLRREALGGSQQRLHLMMEFPSSGHGLLNVTGPLTAWSFTDDLISAPISKEGGIQHIVRFAGNTGSEHWPIWMEAAEAPGQELRLELAFSADPPGNAEMDAFVAALPPWTDSFPMTTYQSAWTFSL